jgi:hypothetical protein
MLPSLFLFFIFIYRSFKENYFSREIIFPEKLFSGKKKEEK